MFIKLMNLHEFILKGTKISHSIRNNFGKLSTGMVCLSHILRVAVKKNRFCTKGNNIFVILDTLIVYAMNLKIGIAIILLINIGINAYTQDKERFQKIFEKETSGELETSKRFKNVTRLSYYPDTLPAWFFNPMQHTGGYYAIGVSDPDMVLDKAKEQAVLRAKSLALLNEECKIQYFKDIYTDAKEVQRYTNLNERFDIYFKLTAKRKVADAMFAVLDTHVTRYNEYVALVKYNPQQTSASDTLYPLMANASAFFVSASYDGAEDNQAEYEMKNYVLAPDQKVFGAEFLFREKGNKFLSISSFNGERLEYPAFPYSYTSPDATSRNQVLVTYNGLWSLLSRQMLFTLMLNTQPYSVKLKNVDQQYRSGVSRLAREIASFSSALEINGIKFVNDTLKFDLSIKGQTNSMW